MKDFLVAFLFLLSGIVAQQIFVCPPRWVQWQDRCYKYNMYNKLKYVDAKRSCEDIGAKLLKVDDSYENEYVEAWLRFNDTQRMPWYTSGVKDLSVPGQFKWASDNSEILINPWLRPDFKTKQGPYIVYTTLDNGLNWGWDLDDGLTERPYICEVEKSLVSRLVTDVRDWTFGALDLNNIERGPRFIKQPESMYYMPKKRKYVEFECITTGNPWPMYSWIRKSSNKVYSIKPDRNNVFEHYTLTGGKLVIHNPSETEDTGTYQCIAENKFGSVLSDPVELKFGFINEFNKNTPSKVVVKQMFGTNLACNPPAHKPEGEYFWHMNEPSNYVRSDLKPHIFISKNGHLYFSRAKFDDAGKYYCMINIPGVEGKTSMPIELVVTSTVANDNPPKILSGFPTSFPTTPTRGKSVRLECFAYGTEDLVYTWTRKGGLPETAMLSDLNRVLVIPNARLEDQGEYTCKVTRQIREGESIKTYNLKLTSSPYFLQPLRDEFVDNDGTLELRCEAESSPSEITYMWYRNAKPLKETYYTNADLKRITLTKNVLRITNVTPKKENGMYQCLARNTLGDSFSSAQVVVMSFPPSFRKRPMDPIRYATVRGNVTLLCGPEGAPKPDLIWIKNGNQLTVGQDVLQKVYLLPNGNLFITRITQSDGGVYRCEATNSLGAVSEQTLLMILPHTSLLRGPKKLKVAVNDTVILPCEAQVNPMLDYTYEWKFNNYEIELDDYKTRVKNLRRGEGLKWGYLIIENIQTNQAGFYRCVVKTTEDESFIESEILVIGAPGEPVNIQGTIKGPSVVEITWVPGPDYGSPISSYIVEGKSEYLDRWTVYKSNVVGQDLIDRRTLVTNLIPDSSYTFRLRAINSYGIGPPSTESTNLKTEATHPYIAPRKVGGGGGKVGLLHITWEPLTKAEQNGPELVYNVFYREEVSQNSNQMEFTKIQIGKDKNELYLLLGSEYYYKPYLVYIIAENIKGKGPASNQARVFSAEGMPQATPNNVRGRPFNESAIEVKWTNLDNTRAMMKGILQGFRINYWRRDTEDSRLSKRQTILGNVDSGLIIGLDPDTYYKITVQVFNGAGNGPLSNIHEETTWRKAPHMAPYRIVVTRESHNTIHVKWMGIVTDVYQEPIQGYKVRYWTAGESMEKATDKKVRMENYATVSGLAKDTRYYLRVLGYSLGGDGTMSSPIVQFEIGEYYFWVQGSNDASSIRPLFAMLLATLVAAVLTHN